MQRNLMIKTGVIIATVLVCIFGVIGFPRSLAEAQANIGERIHLGLDLKGGTHLVLFVHTQDAAKTQADGLIDSIRSESRTRGITIESLDRNDPQSVADTGNIQINIKGVDQAKTSAFRSMIADLSSESWTLTPVNNTDYYLKMKPQSVNALKKNTVDQSIATIERRVNALGLTEQTVQEHGDPTVDAEILVELPGVDDSAHVKELIGQTAQLKVVQEKEGPFQSREAALAGKGGILPLGTELLQWPGHGWYLVNRTAVITGQDIRSATASADTDSPGRWETAFKLSQDGGNKFEKFTSSNIGSNLAVVLDKDIVSVAVIQSSIRDSGRINGLSTQQEASDLELVLKTGALPASISFGNERTVGPSLGADSIHEGIYAGLAGLLAVVLAMLIYYKRAGVNAVLALLLNTILLIAALAYFGATLTLPGIAGIILTVGMAVDSNVLIFERIREELRAGKTIPAAIEAGFGKAWWTIVDTHVTTIVSCLFLFLFGTGPVRGFAVTLVIGLFANVFTAVWVSRVIFDWETSGKELKELSI
jgi:preprotein translocase subunit SecD